MKKYFLIFLHVFMVVKFAWCQKAHQAFINQPFKRAQEQYTLMLDSATDLHKYPRTRAADGSTQYVPISDWTGGFWPGNLWYVYEYTRDTVWKQRARVWTESLEQNQFNTAHHDLGFMMYCSYGNAYRLTGNAKYKAILIQSAKSLCSRFDPRVGCIKSWNSRMSWDGHTLWKFPVIIDNMMNLELLFFASKVTGDSHYRNIAIRHAENTMKNHIRKDYSTYHVVNYDTISGKVLNQQTCQGFADNSTWARGQAWAVYGFTMVYRETHDVRFLNCAVKLANFYLHNANLPADKVPYWDFNVGQPGYVPDWTYHPPAVVPRDASAAAIMSSALLELSGYLGKRGLSYKNAAIQMLASLGSDQYLAAVGTNNHFLLKHCTGSFPHHQEIDAPLVYADYYYLEALLRLRQMEQH